MRRLVMATVVSAALAGVSTPAASAHNAGHFVLPDGTCLEIGSFTEVFPGPGKSTRLDLIPETLSPPFDEIGASFAAFQGNTPILPGPC